MKNVLQTLEDKMVENANTQTTVISFINWIFMFRFTATMMRVAQTCNMLLLNIIYVLAIINYLPTHRTYSYRYIIYLTIFKIIVVLQKKKKTTKKYLNYYKIIMSILLKIIIIHKYIYLSTIYFVGFNIFNFCIHSN